MWGICLYVLLAPCEAAEVLPSPSQPFEQWPSRFARCIPYRNAITRAQRAYLPLLPPEAWAAQLYQESLCEPLAQSPVGASGIAQIMPATWRDISRELRLPPNSTPHEEIAIDAGAYYQGKMMAGWTARRTTTERWQLGQASYNAGFGNILKAQAKSGGKRVWSDIQPYLKLVTGVTNSHETTTYVERIGRWRRELCNDDPYCEEE